jgi:hypothetical protein
MALYTREDDLRFRRTTWLLCKLQVIGPRGDTTSDDPPSPSADVVALQQLSSLANLFVRQHEIVAVIPVIPVIPTASPHQQNLYVAAEVDNEPLSEEELLANEEELLANEEELLANEEELLANEEELLANVIGGPCDVTRKLRRQV